MIKNTDAVRALDDLLGTRTKVAVLRFLCRNRRAFSGREIARRVRRNAANVHKTLRELAAAGILVAETIGRVALFKVKEGNPWVEDVVAPLFEAEAKVERRMWRELAATARPELTSLILFGSRARGDASPGSDIDLLAVVGEGVSATEVRMAMLDVGVRYGLSVEAVVVPIDELAAWARRSPELWANITAQGLTVAGLDLQELRLRVGKREPAARCGSRRH